jgi:CBS domain-containing protein
MHAADIMTTKVITVEADTPVQEIAGLLLKHRISAVPVVDAGRRVVGIVSEGDLMRRAESDTGQRHSWWLETLFSAEEKAAEYIKSHGRKADDVMTRDVLTVTEETPMHKIVHLLETHHIKRVPVVSDGRLVGIVSRANLLHGLAAKRVGSNTPGSADDRTIREKLLHVLFAEAGLDAGMINVIVDDGVVQLWGIVRTSNEKKAAQIAAESMLGVKAVENYLGQVPGRIWAE